MFDGNAGPLDSIIFGETMRVKLFSCVRTNCSFPQIYYLSNRSDPQFEEAVSHLFIF